MTSCRCKNISNMYWTWAEKFSIKTSMLAFSHHVLFPLWQYSQPHCLCPQDAHITACLLLPPLCFIALIGRCVNKVKWATIIPFFWSWGFRQPERGRADRLCSLLRQLKKHQMKGLKSRKSQTELHWDPGDTMLPHYNTQQCSANADGM